MWNVSNIFSIDSSSPTKQNSKEEEPEQEQQLSPSQGQVKKRRSFLVRFVYSLLAFIVLQCPYYTLLVGLTTTRLLHYVTTTYYHIQLYELLPWTQERQAKEATYYGRICTSKDSTTSNPLDLIVSDESEGAVPTMLKHGITIYPNLISTNTSQQLRETIIEYNTIEENYHVIGKDNRNSYGIQLDQHPVVRIAMNEILSNDLLVDSLTQIIGDDPAVYKFHAIT